MNYYIKPSPENAVIINNIMYNTYCYNSVTGEWIYPFQPGTQYYYDVNALPWIVTDLLRNAVNDPQLSQADQELIAAELATELNYFQAVEAGWLPSPTDD
jgi:hypothetical protein